jgi:hypothetical protein
MKNFRLYLQSYKKWPESIKELTSLRRRHQEIEVSIGNDNESKLFLELSQNVGSSVKKFYLARGKFRKPNDFLAILKSMPLLEELRIEGMQFENSQEVTKPVVLEKLKKLTVG